MLLVIYYPGQKLSNLYTHQLLEKASGRNGKLMYFSNVASINRLSSELVLLIHMVNNAISNWDMNSRVFDSDFSILAKAVHSHEVGTGVASL